MSASEAQPSGPVSPIAKARVSDRIITELEHRIARGDLARGAKLPTEKELAAQYGVSAPTVREAVRALSSMGLIEVRHGSGAYVAADSRAILDRSLAMLVQWERVGVEDLLGLLRVLHLYVGELALASATDEEVAEAARDAEETRTKIGKQALNDSFSEFLSAFVRTAHQPLLDALCSFLTKVLVDLELKYHPDQSNRYWKQWASDSAALRLSVAHALEARDGDKLRSAISDFHDGIRSRVLGLPGVMEARVIE